MKTKEDYKTEFMLFLDLRTHRPDRDLRMLGNEILVKFKEIIEEIYISQSLTPMSEEEIRELAKKFLSLRILSKGARIEGGKVIHSTVDGENNANREISRISEFIVEFQSHFLTSKATESKPEITPMSEEEIDKWIEDAEFTEYNMIFKEDLPSWLIDFQSHLLSRVENKPVTLGKNSCLLDYTFPGGRFYMGFKWAETYS